MFSFQVDGIAPDPDPNSMYLDPQHWMKHELVRGGIQKKSSKLKT